LLLCDAGPDGPAWNVADVAAALGVGSRAICGCRCQGGRISIRSCLHNRMPVVGTTRDQLYRSRMESIIMGGL